MPKIIYILISNSDGDTYIKTIAKEELVMDLKDGIYEHVDFLSKIPDMDTNYWPPNSCLLLKAEIIVPKATEVAIKYDID